MRGAYRLGRLGEAKDEAVLELLIRGGFSSPIFPATGVFRRERVGVLHAQYSARATRTEKEEEYGYTGAAACKCISALQKYRGISNHFAVYRSPDRAAVYLAPQLGWFMVALSMIVYMLFLGRWISGRPLGVLINERNLMSLSRFQMVAWTILLLSAFFTVALKRLHVLSPNQAAAPLNIAMDWRLWALMGISATSLVGTPLLLSSKSCSDS